MKKALVLSLAVLIGLGAAAFGQFTGYWSTTIGIDPQPLAFISMDSTLNVAYALSGWTFTSTSKFDLNGWKSQDFKVAGALGAFTLQSTMSFAPAVVSEKTYPTLTGLVYDAVYLKGFAGICPWVATPVKWAPQFLTWDVTAGVNIAGVALEAYVLQDLTGSDAVKLDKYLFYSADYLPQTPSAQYHFTQTDSVTCADSTVLKGMGWRLLLGGSIGGMDITSYTYFNLDEMDQDAYLAGVVGSPSTCPIIGKSGYFSVGSGCNTGLFTEEYLTVEGISFGCATVNAALKILCGTGFDSLKLLVEDIGLGNWGLFTFAITFATTDKAVATCIELTPLAGPCFTVELGGISGTSIESISINGFKFSSTFGGVTFTDYTELNIASKLMSTSTAWTYLNGPTQVGFLVPFTGKNAACTGYVTSAEKLYEVKCLATERYKLWEKFVIDVKADACCGGLFGLNIATSFGDQEVLDYAAYAILPANSNTYGTPVYLVGSTGATFTNPTGTPATHEIVTWKSGYATGVATTLFNWAKTSVALSVGLSSNVTLSAGFDISVYGWDKMTFGFKWSF